MSEYPDPSPPTTTPPRAEDVLTLNPLSLCIGFCLGALTTMIYALIPGATFSISLVIGIFFAGIWLKYRKNPPLVRFS